MPINAPRSQEGVLLHLRSLKESVKPLGIFTCLGTSVSSKLLHSCNRLVCNFAKASTDCCAYNNSGREHSKKEQTIHGDSA